jgi:hypothetical protein
MCGAENDPVVYYDMNTKIMADFWDTTVTNNSNANPFASALDLTATPAGSFAAIQTAWQAQAPQPTGASIHGATGAYCAGAGLALFNTLK